MDNADRFRLIERLVVASPDIPTWDALAAELDLPDDRWTRYDPAASTPELQATWTAFDPDWDGVGALWLGIESNVGTYLDPVAYASLDETGFPKGLVWHGPALRSDALTDFSSLTTQDHESDAYDYGGALAWAALTVRLLSPAPSHVSTLVGFGGGDWLVFPGETLGVAETS